VTFRLAPALRGGRLRRARRPRSRARAQLEARRGAYVRRVVCVRRPAERARKARAADRGERLGLELDPALLLDVHGHERGHRAALRAQGAAEVMRLGVGQVRLDRSN
jgi:hypothetical protein